MAYQVIGLISDLIIISGATYFVGTKISQWLKRFSQTIRQAGK